MTFGGDHQENEDMIENGASAISSSAMHQHRTPQTEDQSLALVIENERLRGEIDELRRQVIHMDNFQKQQQAQARISRPPIPKQNGSTIKSNKSSAVLEIPEILHHSSSSSRASFTENIKDHQSDSTADDRETVERAIDIELHQSSTGLHHRSSITNASGSMVNSNNTTTTAAFSTILTLKTKRSDDDSSSKACYDEEDPLAEAQGLISGESLVQKHRNSLREKGIKLRRPASIAALSTTGEDNIPNYHQMNFWSSLTDRAAWLIGLLILQSLSSFILAHNESLLQNHTVIVQFLTMLVGAGGNAGNQASVGVVRGIAVGSINRSNVRRVLAREFAMGAALSLILGLSGFVRAKVFAVPWMETYAITTSLFFIVIISVAVGATLPLGMQAVGIDPAHSSTTIQVIMDITGVVITVHVSSIMLGSGFSEWLESLSAEEINK